jgi:hypothetical protein
MSKSDLQVECFTESYEQARTKFLASASNSDAKIYNYEHPEYYTPDNEKLTIDVAVYGPDGADNACLILSGTHGPEGFTGSAAQIALMKSGLLSEYQNDIRVVLVHAVNPYGFAHISRTTENNVDLNRNFVDFSTTLPANSRYRELHDYLCPQEWHEGSAEKIINQSNQWIFRNSFTEWFDALNGGQYEFKDGLYYGGQKREWSNLSLEKIVSEHLGGVKKLGFIDWHTGLGEPGEPFFLCFNEQDDKLWQRCSDWWGKSQIEEAAKNFQDGKRPTYTGLVFQGVQRFIAPAEMAGAVIEFGTEPLMDMFTQHCVDRWIRFGEQSDDEELRNTFRSRFKDASCPPDVAWREGVITHALNIQTQLLEGVQAW